MAPVDVSDEGRFYGSEGGRVGVFGEFVFGGVIVKDTVGLVWMGTC